MKVHVNVHQKLSDTLTPQGRRLSGIQAWPCPHGTCILVDGGEGKGMHNKAIKTHARGQMAGSKDRGSGVAIFHGVVLEKVTAEQSPIK